MLLYRTLCLMKMGAFNKRILFLSSGLYRVTCIYLYHRFYYIFPSYLHLYTLIFNNLLALFLSNNSFALYLSPLLFLSFFSIFSSTPLGNFPIDLAALNLNGSTWLQIKIQTASRFERQFLFLYRRSDGFCSLS